MFQPSPGVTHAPSIYSMLISGSKSLSLRPKQSPEVPTLQLSIQMSKKNMAAWSLGVLRVSIYIYITEIITPMGKVEKCSVKPNSQPLPHPFIYIYIYILCIYQLDLSCSVAHASLFYN